MVFENDLKLSYFYVAYQGQSNSLTTQIMALKPCKYLIVCILLTVYFTGNQIHAQVVQSVGEKRKNSISVYISDYPDQADLHVFIVDNKKDALGNQGLWYFQDSQTYAQKKIYFVDDSKTADLIIYFTEEKSQAGWIRKTKQKLFE